MYQFDSRLMKWIAAIVLSIFFLKAEAQQIAFTFSDSVVVLNGQDTLLTAWQGGLHAPQLSKSDFNNDGYKDIFVFDRYDNSIVCYLYNVTTARFEPDYSYSKYFPALSGWVLLADYNCDGKEDIFTSSGSGVKVYQNTTTGTTLSYTLMYSPLLPFNGSLSIPSIDMPTLTDVDNDSDLDLLAFDFAGSIVIFYKNLQVENSLSCDTLLISKEAQCWGQFQESNTTSDITLGISCKGNTNNDEEKTLHVGSTLLAFDADGDNDKELLVGDISSTKLIYLENGGTPQTANMVSQNNTYPASQPIDIYAFPAAFRIDAENDGKTDLVVCPNDGSESTPRNYNQVWYYQNTGTESNPIFTFKKEDLFSGEMIETGSGAAPAFLDTDADGDLDLLIGNYAYRISPTSNFCSLTHYKNIGTNQLPVYQYDTNDYAGLRQKSYYNITPTFGDIDGDGDTDMLLGETNGMLIHYENTAGTGNAPVFTFITDNYKTIDIGSNSTPNLIDIDRDNDLDLLIGEKDGNINYYQNTGTAGSANFVLITDSLGKINTKNGTSSGYSAPYVTDLDNDGKYDLAVGASDGNLYIYNAIETNLNGAYTATANTCFENAALKKFKESRRVIPSFCTFSGRQYPDLYLGMYKGGIRYYKNISYLPNLKTKQTNKQTVNKLYPNPFSENIIVETQAEGTLILTDLQGRILLESALTKGVNSLTIAAKLAPGMYLYSIQVLENIQYGKILKK